MLAPLEKPTGDLLDGTSKLQWAATSALQWDGMSMRLMGKQPFGRSWESHPHSASLKLGEHFSRDAKLWETLCCCGGYLSLTFASSCSAELQLALLIHPKPLLLCQGTEELRLTPCQAICRKNSLGGPFAHGILALENDSRHSGHDFSPDLVTSALIRVAGWDAEPEIRCVQPQLHLPEKNSAKQAGGARLTQTTLELVQAQAPQTPKASGPRASRPPFTGRINPPAAEQS